MGQVVVMQSMGQVQEVDRKTYSGKAEVNKSIFIDLLMINGELKLDNLSPALVFRSLFVMEWILYENVYLFCGRVLHES